MKEIRWDDSDVLGNERYYGNEWTEREEKKKNLLDRIESNMKISGVNV